MRAPTRSGVARAAMVLGCVAAVALIAIGAIRTHQLDREAHRNDALVDRATTTEVARRAAAAMTGLWSYDYRHLDRTTSRLATLSTPSFRKEYDKVYRNVGTLAPQAKAVVTAKVVDAAVETLDGGHAVVIVFLDQTADKRATDQTSSAGARLRVEMVRDGDHWLVNRVAPF